MSQPPTSRELLDHALSHQAPHLVKTLDKALRRLAELEDIVSTAGFVPALDGERVDVPDDVLAQLAKAVDRRVYIATKQHDDRVAEVLDAAAMRVRNQYRAERQLLDDVVETIAADPTPQRDHSAAEQAAAAVERKQHCASDPCMGWCLLDDQGRSCAELGAPVRGDDPLIGVPVVTSGYTAAEQAQVDEFMESRTVTPGYPVGG